MQTEQRNSLRLLQWMMAASLALPVALFVFAAAISWISTRDTADRQIERSLDVAHEHALKVFETIDRSLSEINETIRDLPDADIRAREPQLHLRLKQLVEALPQMKSAWIFDAQGRALVNSLVSPVPALDFSDRDYFTAHIAKDVGIFIGDALTPRAPYQGQTFFSVSRRRQREDGSFAGVIQASVLPEYFENFYARIGHDPGSFFKLGLTDGTVLARFPVVDRDILVGPVGHKIAANPPAGLTTLISSVDGAERRLGYQRLAQYPVYVSAGLETSAIRARWLATIGNYLVFGLPATALLFLILSLALGRTRRLYFESARRREAEEALKHSQRLEALGQLTGGVAHDFNNLLTVIRASVDLLRRPHLPDERRRHYVEAISDTVGRATKLTAQLLAFARRQTLKPEAFDVGECVQTLSGMIGTLTGSSIEIVTRRPDEPCFINADAGQFETALINMAVNARDAMGDRGRLTIAIRAVAKLPDPVTQSPSPQNPHGYVAVSVEDTGVGIPQDQLGRIFEPFFTTKEVGQGTGLGLSQVFGFAKQSGGEVMVASEIGKGSTFTLYLPRVPGSDRRQQILATDAPALGGDGMSVLVVEDNLEVGTFAADALTELGYVPTLVSNAIDAMTELTRNADRYDVVFSDVVMPGMSGIDLAKEIRRRHFDLPVVLTSGYSQMLSQNGSYGFDLLQKPYSVEQLSRALHKVCRRRMKRSAAE